MCRLLGYLGAPISLDRVLLKPEHSLVVQSYQPQEMTAGLLNADGFGVGWYHAQRREDPYTYRNVLPIWNDVNLPNLARYVESSCLVANVRSATPGLPVELGNCQPFQGRSLLFTHNGFIERFRQTVYRPMRDRLGDAAYHAIQGNTDSEHLFGLFLQFWEEQGEISLAEALQETLAIAFALANQHQISLSANLIVTDGTCMVASRAAVGGSVPSLYWLRDDLLFPDAVVIASEPICPGDWTVCPEQTLLTVTESLDVHLQPL
jgi:glutamine amidotransferase